MFNNYTTANGLIDDKILCMAVGPDNTLYVGTYSGLSIFDRTQWTHLSSADGLPGDVVVAVAVNDSGGIWVSGFDIDDTAKGRIGYFVDGEWDTFPLFNQLIHSIVPDRRREIFWFFSEDGVSWCDGVNWGKLETNFFALSCSDIRVAASDAFSDFWLGTRDGVYRYNWNEFIQYTAADGLLHNTVTTISKGGPNELWVGTEKGPSLYFNQAWTTFPDIGLNQKLTSAIAADDEKGVWVGTMSGVSRYHSQKWTPYTSANGLVNNRVTAIVCDRLGNAWIGTHGGISRFSLR